VCENRVLRRIFGPKSDEVTWGCRKLPNEELNPLNAELNPICHLLALLGAHLIFHVSRIRVNDVFLTQNYSGDKIEKNDMGGACSAYGDEERRIQGFGGETRGKETTWETQA